MIQENAFLGKLPLRIIFGFLKASAVNGVYHQNPFNFEHFNLNYTTLVVSSRQQSTKVFSLSFVGDEVDYVREYLQMYIVGLVNLLKMKTLVLATMIFSEVILYLFLI